MTKPTWTRAWPVSELPHGSIRTWKPEGRQLAVVHDEEGRVFAVDNRCPHEGYPLAQGDLKGCVLTCAWHNWKFDLTDGSCVLGGEGVRTYPTRVAEGVLEVDLSEPDPEVAVPALRRSLEEGLFRHDNGRAIRDAVRLLLAGYPPSRLLADLARYDALHAEYGTTHVLPLAADCGRMLDRYAGVDAMYVVAQVIDLCGESNARLALRERPPALPGATALALREAVEREDAVVAEGLVRGALESGIARREVEAWLCAAMSDHFTDFGHELIFLVKAQDLLDQLERAAPSEAMAYAADLYGGLVYATVIATREDTLPYMRGYFRRLAEVEGDLAAVRARARSDASFDAARFADAVLDGKASEASDALWSALRDGVPAERVAEALVGAAAIRLFRFDLDVDRSADVQEGWLWATHRLTFASAVRAATRRFQSPDVLRLLVQAVAFIHSGRGMDAPPERRLAIVPEPGTAEEVAVAIVQRRPEAAVRLAAGCLARDGSATLLRPTLEDLCLRDPLVRPIFLCHAVKTTVAAFDEYQALAGHPLRAWPVLATVRFLASPVVERTVHRAVRTSIQWVAEGVLPRKLTQ